jgi:hypothetical protein
MPPLALFLGGTRVGVSHIEIVGRVSTIAGSLGTKIPRNVQRPGRNSRGAAGKPSEPTGGSPCQSGS